MAAIAVFFICLLFWFIGFNMGADTNKNRVLEHKLKMCKNTLRTYKNGYSYTDLAEETLEELEDK